ncbi:MAG: phosphatase PAP2 family protein [bacterium]
MNLTLFKSKIWDKKWLNKFLLFDFLTLGYLLIVSLFILFSYHQVPSAKTILLLHLFGTILILIITFFPKPLLLRYCYPIIIFTFFYEESSILNRIIFKNYLDTTFQKIENLIFGFQPSLELIKKFNYFVIKEILFASYFSFYILIITIPLLLYYKNKDYLLHFMNDLCLIFYFCYTIFIILPVIGPPVWGLPKPQGLFGSIMGLIYKYGEKGGAAFPSSHVAVSLLILTFVYRYLPKLKIILTIDVLLLIISTVYCQYHYAIDVLGGVIAWWICLFLGDKLHNYYRFSEK